MDNYNSIKQPEESSVGTRSKIPLRTSKRCKKLYSLKSVQPRAKICIFVILFACIISFNLLCFVWAADKQQQSSQQPHQLTSQTINRSHQHHNLAKRHSAGLSQPASEPESDQSDQTSGESNDSTAAAGDEGADELASTANSTSVDYDTQDGPDETPIEEAAAVLAQQQAIVRPSRHSHAASEIGGLQGGSGSFTTTMRNFVVAESATQRPQGLANMQPQRNQQFVSPTTANGLLQEVTTQRSQLQSLNRRQQQQDSHLLMAPTTTSLNINMGAERLLIKPHNERPPTMQSASPADELGSETIKHEAINPSMISVGGGGGGNSVINERRQDLLYPSPSISHPATTSIAATNHESLNQQLATEFREQQSICYTPVALLMVILVTMMITILVCFCTHILIRHLGRHQFDLIENSKHFSVKHGSEYLQQQQQRQGAPLSSQTFHCQQNGNQHQLQTPADPARLIKSANNERLLSGGRPRDDGSGCAFDNPYFKDDNYLRKQQQARLYHQQQHDQFNLKSASSNGIDNLDFIEHHISNLHSRQVTSSVKELTIFGGNQTHQQPHPVVDLTSEEHRAKVLANPREGDLIAVDITGHDFIGLGFEICSDTQDGNIYVKSVLARGPARESGCIEAGDRIKCLNISFDNITLQDAYDILNCGSPYKMRLLIEKQSAFVQSNLRSTLTMRQFTNNNHQKAIGQLQIEPQGPLSATKTYIKKLTKFVSPGAQNCRPSCDNSTPQQVRSPPMYLGSSVARQHLIMTQNSHNNNAFGSDEAPQTHRHHDEFVDHNLHEQTVDNHQNQSRPSSDGADQQPQTATTSEAR